MLKQKNIAIWFKFNGLLRYILMHSLSEYLPLYVINEYPKSGGTWVGEILSDALGVPFPRNRLPMLRSCVLHGHFMQSWNIHNIVIVWRDGRDVLVSLYFYSLFDNGLNQKLVAKCRSDLGFDNYEDIVANLPAFIEYVFEKKRHPKMSWMEFVDRWAGRRECVHVHYEDLHAQPVEELMRIVTQLSGISISRENAEAIVDNHSFERVTSRKIGEENRLSFMRKGIVGDWKNYFNMESRKHFHAYAGDALITLGYEEDSAWVSNIIDDESRSEQSALGTYRYL